MSIVEQQKSAIRESNGDFMREKKKLTLPVIVEGRYDKNTLSQIFDAVIIPVDGFGIFNSKEKQAMIKKIGEKGVILLTDSDGGGKQIRSFILGILPRERVYNLYIPKIEGKERRKAKASKAGLLGVEGMPPDVLLDLFKPFISNKKSDTGADKEEISALDFYNDGLSGGDGASVLRARLAVEYGLPDDISAKALREALNLLSSRDEYRKVMEKIVGSTDE